MIINAEYPNLISIPDFPSNHAVKDTHHIGDILLSWIYFLDLTYVQSDKLTVNSLIHNCSSIPVLTARFLQFNPHSAVDGKRTDILEMARFQRSILRP